MPDDLMEKANALMRRRRVFVAGAPEQKSLLGEDDGDGVPVLLDVVDGAAEPPDPDPLYELLLAKQQLLAAELAAWLDAELPRIVTASVDGLTDRIVAQVTEEARAALLPRLQAALEADQPEPPAE